MDPRTRTKVYPALCALALVVSILLIRPFVEIGLGDDFSYVRTAKYLAETGHLNYFGWATPMLGWQLLLGALFAKLFGFSFAVVRSSVFLIAVVTSVLLQRTFVRFGLNEFNSAAATLILILSPLYLPLSFSFMSDVAGLFSLVLCLYCCARAVEAAERRSAFNWWIAAAISNLVFGSARQIAWLGVLVLVPSTFWLLRRWRLSWITGVAFWLGCVAVVFGAMHWFQHQAFSQQEKIFRHSITPLDVYNLKYVMVKFLLAMCLYMLPVTIAYLAYLAMRKRSYLVLVTLAVLLIAAGIRFGLHSSHNVAVVDLLAPFDGDIVNPDGAVDMPSLGPRPLLLDIPVRVILTLLAAAGTMSFLFALGGLWRKSSPADAEQSTTPSAPSWLQLGFLFGPFTLAYFTLLIPRGLFAGITDRYMLPLLILALIVSIRLYQERVRPNLPVISLVTLAIFALYGIASTHDRFEMQRGQLAAANELTAANIPRNAFLDGFEYDGWTQIDEWGYVDNSRINFPPGFVPKIPDPTDYPCGYTPARFMPAIHPQFGVSFSPDLCDGPSEFPAVTFHTWLPPRSVNLYIVRIAKPRPVDPAKRLQLDLK